MSRVFYFLFSLFFVAPFKASSGEALPVIPIILMGILALPRRYSGQE